MASSVISQQAMSTFAATEALRIVLREEQPAAMADVLLDMERARMTAEDYRGAMASPYSTCGLPPHTRTLSWREVGVQKRERCIHLNVDVIEPAKKLLHDARHEILTALSGRNPNYKADVCAAHNAMLKVERRLEDNSNASESEGES